MSITTPNLWPVIVSGLGKALIIGGPTSPPSGWSAGVVYAAGPSGGYPGLQIRFGNASFSGNGAALVSTGVGHGLGVAPNFVMIFPALASGGAWSATIGQYQSADSSSFYVYAQGTVVAGSNPTALNVFASGSTYYFNWLAIAGVS
jgi:hypothetical protein